LIEDRPEYRRRKRRAGVRHEASTNSMARRCRAQNGRSRGDRIHVWAEVPRMSDVCAVFE
jgi:hypothetical protein